MQKKPRDVQKCNLCRGPHVSIGTAIDHFSADLHSQFIDWAFLNGWVERASVFSGCIEVSNSPLFGCEYVSFVQRCPFTPLKVVQRRVGRHVSLKFFSVSVSDIRKDEE